MNQKAFLLYSKIVLILVFLVILAGGVVRMTQSGMGCPDWPKCFGQWIPPTNESQLPANYKEIYAFKYVDLSFNPYHTWVEYINRLLGMLLGIFLLIQFIWVVRYWRSMKRTAIISGITLILTGFQGYLGSKVVEANLEVVKITIHMLVALIIASLTIMIINNVSAQKEIVVSRRLKNLAFVTLILLIFQITLGTQVRQQIDDISKAFNFNNREQWISKLNIIFYIHRSFSLVIAGFSGYLAIQYIKMHQFKTIAYIVIISVLGNILLGAVMTYLNIPSIAQPMHLMLSVFLLTSLFYLWLNTKRATGTISDY